MLKYVRIAVTALSLTACALLVALWVRSYGQSIDVDLPVSSRAGVGFLIEDGTIAVLAIYQKGKRMELKVIKPTMKRTTFNLKGKTCNEIVEELNEKFPGHFTAHPKFDIKMNASDKSVKSVTISADGSIKLPAWPKVKSMGENTQKEWKRFLSKLDKHEEGHRLILLESMAIVADEAQKWYDAKIEKGEVPDGYELDKLYKEEWYGKYYDPPQDKYDTDTENGKKEGAWFEASRCD